MTGTTDRQCRDRRCEDAVGVSVSKRELTTILTTTVTTVAASTTSPTPQFAAYRDWSRLLLAPGSVGVRGSSPLSSTLTTRSDQCRSGFFR
jgi:hypothetical protein